MRDQDLDQNSAGRSDGPTLSLVELRLSDKNMNLNSMHL